VHWLQALADASSAGIEAVRAKQEAESLAEANVLLSQGSGSDHVRMCAWTKRLFHEGAWVSVEAFLRARFGVDVTHSMSDDVAQRLNREINTLSMRRESY
jgi:hypothetical protein